MPTKQESITTSLLSALVLIGAVGCSGESSAVTKMESAGGVGSGASTAGSGSGTSGATSGLGGGGTGASSGGPMERNPSGDVDADTPVIPATFVADASATSGLEADAQVPGADIMLPATDASIDAATPTAPDPAVCSAPQGNSTAVHALVAGDIAFAVSLYAPTMTAAGSGHNAIVSPYSVSTALTMVDVGAAGETATQMQSVLHLPDTGANVAPAYTALACQNETDGESPGNQLSIANSLWAQQGKTFVPTFLSTLATGYDAPLQLVDFAADSTGATSIINQWVSNATQTEIPTLFQPGDITSKTRLVLADAVYFKGTWDSGFDPTETSSQPFMLSDGTEVSVPTMSGLVNLRTSYAQAPALFVYELPYKGGSLAMDFVVSTGSLSSFESSLTSDALSMSLSSIGSPVQTQLLLPKFSFTTHVVLDPILTALGMPDAFASGTANLSGMDGQMDLLIGRVVHQAQVEVDESGTVATAATGVDVCDNCAAVIETPMVVIDHPFVFLIRDTRTGSILFMGHVEDPRQG